MQGQQLVLSQFDSSYDSSIPHRLLSNDDDDVFFHWLHYSEYDYQLLLTLSHCCNCKSLLHKAQQKVAQSVELSFAQ